MRRPTYLKRDHEPKTTPLSELRLKIADFRNLLQSLWLVLESLLCRLLNVIPWESWLNRFLDWFVVTCPGNSLPVGLFPRRFKLLNGITEEQWQFFLVSAFPVETIKREHTPGWCIPLEKHAIAEQKCLFLTKGKIAFPSPMQRLVAVCGNCPKWRSNT